MSKREIVIATLIGGFIALAIKLHNLRVAENNVNATFDTVEVQEFIGPVRQSVEVVE